jgi:glutamate formiminotransferase
MRLVAIPSWSFARERWLLNSVREILSHPKIDLHSIDHDLDWNRTVTAFSGEAEVVADMVMRLAITTFDSIDLRKHVGTYARIGALDDCPLIIQKPDKKRRESQVMEALTVAENLAGLLSATFELPIFLEEKSDRGRHEGEIASLRMGGLAGLQGRKLHPDFGPSTANPRLGVTTLGVRDFFIAVAINFESQDVDIPETLARQIERMREEGDPRMLGVRAMGLALPSRESVQLNLNLMLPDLTPVDPIIEFVRGEVRRVGVKVTSTQLVGPLRDTDLAGTTRCKIEPARVIPTS